MVRSKRLERFRWLRPAFDAFRGRQRPRSQTTPKLAELAPYFTLTVGHLYESMERFSVGGPAVAVFSVRREQEPTEVSVRQGMIDRGSFRARPDAMLIGLIDALDDVRVEIDRAGKELLSQIRHEIIGED